jgi:hypothetical protein
VVQSQNFVSLGTTIERKVKKRFAYTVDIVKSVTLLNDVIRGLESLTEVDLHKFTALNSDPRAYMLSSKRNNASSQRAVFARNKFCRQAPSLGTNIIRLQ